MNCFQLNHPVPARRGTAAAAWRPRAAPATQRRRSRRGRGRWRRTRRRRGRGRRRRRRRRTWPAPEFETVPSRISRWCGFGNFTNLGSNKDETVILHIWNTFWTPQNRELNCNFILKCTFSHAVTVTVTFGYSDSCLLPKKGLFKCILKIWHFCPCV